MTTIMIMDIVVYTTRRASGRTRSSSPPDRVARTVSHFVWRRFDRFLEALADICAASETPPLNEAASRQLFEDFIRAVPRDDGNIVSTIMTELKSIVTDIQVMEYAMLSASRSELDVITSVVDETNKRIIRVLHKLDAFLN
jgi:hypothetical protein